MNRVVWLPALILIAIAGTGCQTAKFPSPKWPDFAMFKKKDKDLAPPSEHFDVTEPPQVAGNTGSERKPMEIPGEAPAGAVRVPADSAKPTAAMVGTKSGSGAATTASAKTGNPPSATQPIRKPYEIGRSSADAVKQAAGTIAADLEQSSQAAADQVARNTNEVVGQFQQQGRDLANAANSSLNQAASDLNRKANTALGAINPAAQPADSASSGGAFAFSRPTNNPPAGNAPPPWSNPSAPTAAAANPTPAFSSPSAPAAGPIDPLKSLAAGSALAPAPASTPSTSAPSGFNPKPIAGAERQLQPINQQLVNQNLGAPANNPAPASNPASNAGASQFQLPVAQPPAFVANRTSTPAASAAPAPVSSAPPAAAPQFNPQNANQLGAAQPAAPQAGSSPQNNVATQAGSNKYPSTGFNSFVASGSNAPNPALSATGGSAFAPSAGTNSGLTPQSPRPNAEWQNQASPIAATSGAPASTANRPVSHSAELPAELMQRSGGYAPGSIRGGTSGETLWR